MMESGVAVIVLNWRRPAATNACLESLRVLSPRPDVIVVDNGSHDGSVESIRAEHKWVEVVELGRNLGFSGGMNAGISAAMNRSRPPEFVWLLNNDTHVESAALEALLTEAREAVGAVGSVLLDASGSQVTEWGGASLSRVLWTTRPLRGPDPVGLGCLTGASILLRVAALRDVGAFDERFFFYLEDTDLSLRLSRAGWRLRVASGSRVRHALGGTLAGGTRSTDPRAHELYARAVGTFIGIWSPWPLRPLQLALRLGAMVASRVLRGQARFIPIVVRAYLEGIRISRRPPAIPFPGREP